MFGSFVSETNPLRELLRRRQAHGPAVAICAHRGASVRAPENTLAAFRQALDEGAGMVEFDIQRTSNDEVVVIHDVKLDRTTDGRGVIRRLSLQAVRSVDAGRHFGEEFAGERVPLLDEALELILGRGAVPMIEIKGWHRRVRGIEEPLAAVLRNHRALSEVVLVVHDRATAEAVRRSCDGALVSLLTFTKRNARSAAKRGFDGVDPYWKSLSRRLVNDLHGRRLFLTPWTVNRPRDMRRLLMLGVDAMITDDPALLRSVVEEKLDASQLAAAAEITAGAEDLDLEGLDSDEEPGSDPPPSMARRIWLEGSRKWRARKARIADKRTARHAKKRQATKDRH